MSHNPLLQHLCRAELTLKVTPGELYDRLTILWIKRRNGGNLPERAQQHLRHQIETIEAPLFCIGDNTHPPELEKLIQQLKAVNSNLWIVEDEIRELDAQVFPVADADRTVLNRFAELARTVYILNTTRHKVKRQIDEICGRMPEIKHYTEFAE